MNTFVYSANGLIESTKRSSKLLNGSLESAYLLKLTI